MDMLIDFHDELHFWTQYFRKEINNINTQILELQSRLIKERDIENNIICVIEEMSELTKVLTKYLRNSSKFSIDNLIEEISHSLLMINVIKNRFEITEEEIEKYTLKALKNVSIKHNRSWD